MELEVYGHKVVVKAGQWPDDPTLGRPRIVEIDGQEVFQVGMMCDPIYLFQQIRTCLGLE